MTAPPIIVTGAAGFIGFHAASRLLEAGEAVVGVDALVPIPEEPRLRNDRLAELSRHARFTPVRLDLADEAGTRALFERHRPRRVLHLAARAGVRESIAKPMPYVTANVVAFLNVLESCRDQAVEHLVYASSSSVYGANRKQPYAVSDAVDHPVSLYAATKRSDELMAHAYSHLFGLATTGLRYFTVYGPWGRPDMAVYRFTDNIANGRPITVANGGDVWRDFTYIDDAVEATLRLLDRRATPDPARDPERPEPGQSADPYRIYNIGGDRPEKLDRLIALIEQEVGRKAIRRDATLPPGDVYETRAEIGVLAREIGFAPTTPLEVGVKHFVTWYRGRHG